MIEVNAGQGYNIDDDIKQIVSLSQEKPCAYNSNHSPSLKQPLQNHVRLKDRHMTLCGQDIQEKAQIHPLPSV